MPIEEGWFEENRPLRDPDYVRMAEATNLLDAELRELGDPDISYGRRVTMGTLTRYAMRRAEQTTAESPQEAPSERDLLVLLMSVSFEGFATGVLFRRSASSQRDALMDRLTLADAGNTLAMGVGSEGAASAFYEALVSMEALQFVSMARSYSYSGKIRQGAMSHQQVKQSQAALWMDMFLLGAVFAELGGHRPKPAG